MRISIYIISYSKILIAVPLMEVATGGNLTISIYIYSKNHSNKLKIMPVGEDSPLQVSERFSLGTMKKRKGAWFLFWGISKIHTENALGGNLNRWGYLSMPPYLSFSVFVLLSRSKWHLLMCFVPFYPLNMRYFEFS